MNLLKVLTIGYLQSSFKMMLLETSKCVKHILQSRCFPTLRIDETLAHVLSFMKETMCVRFITLWFKLNFFCIHIKNIGVEEMSNWLVLHCLGTNFLDLFHFYFYFHQDLLQLQYEGAQVMNMFNRAKINVNLLIFLINKKFYGK